MTTEAHTTINKERAIGIAQHISTMCMMSKDDDELIKILESLGSYILGMIEATELTRGE